MPCLTHHKWAVKQPVMSAVTPQQHVGFTQQDSDLEQLLTIDPPSLTPLESSLAPAETVTSSLHMHNDDRLSTYSVGETLYNLEGYGLDILPAGVESDRQVMAPA
ncbi:hypothetical protein PISMIDRAFT_13439 [Pisolithus microcarpus 441]|uniref:Uncharacterized protein n=1 Tax=Pisolithus microcarpus 441 TaxID=765257 RepID=A0A0C9YST9_9AGAM|nr:hypothetical protein PISMIDRAFT_13439 [Pisolithus microcarpus 441]